MTIKKVIFYLNAVLIFFTYFFLYSCTFNLNAPQVIKVSIREGERITDLDSFKYIDIYFSKSMNKYLTEKNISISGYYGIINYQWHNNDREVKLFLVDGLENGLEYTLIIGRGCECSEGINLKNEYSCTFYTYEIEDDFCVVSTFPEDGESVVLKKVDGDIVFLTPEGTEVSGANGSFQIKIDFSLPVEETTIYDKVSIEPSISFNYVFTNKRKTLLLKPSAPLDMNELYTVRIEDELCAEVGKHLKQAYAFSFNTIINQDPFSIINVKMKNQEKSIELNFEGYPGYTSGVEKDMSLFVGFNSDFYLHSVKDFIFVEPQVLYHLEKEEGENHVLCFNFDNGMVQEETYRVRFDQFIANTAGISLDRDYLFEWVVDGQASCFLKVERIEIIDPIGINNTVVFQDGSFYHNRSMLFRQEGGENIVGLKVFFSREIDLYPSLNGFSLNFLFGNSFATGGKLYNYSFDKQSKILEFEFCLPILTEGGNATYKFIIAGGEDGVEDKDLNPLKEDIEVYMIYPAPE